MTYLMSWERNTQNDKYESIQHGYSEIDFYEDEEDLEIVEISLDEMLDNGYDFENEMEME
jgi:hypothetical protein